MAIYVQSRRVLFPEIGEKVKKGLGKKIEKGEANLGTVCCVEAVF